MTILTYLLPVIVEEPQTITVNLIKMLRLPNRIKRIAKYTLHRIVMKKIWTAKTARKGFISLTMP